MLNPSRDILRLSRSTFPPSITSFCAIASIWRYWTGTPMGSSRGRLLLGSALRSRDRLLQPIRASGGLVGMRRWSSRCAVPRADILLVVLKGW